MAQSMDCALFDCATDPFLHDLELFHPFCEICAIPAFRCLHADKPQAACVAVQLLDDLEPVSSSPNLDGTAPDLTPIVEYVRTTERQSSMNDHLRYINENETVVDGVTVQAHIQGIYTPGDRLEQQKLQGPRKKLRKRQTARPGGYPCQMNGCERVFDRACDLNRHHKIHLCSSERSHQCPTCHRGFSYPKDLDRHRRKHAEPSAQVTFFCPYPDCCKGFSRRDNLLRHQQRQHPSIMAASKRSVYKYDPSGMVCHSHSVQEYCQFTSSFDQPSA